LLQDLSRRYGLQARYDVRLNHNPAMFNYLTNLPETDFRLVLVLRDIYHSLVSGYLVRAKIDLFLVSVALRCAGLKKLTFIADA